MTDKQETCSVCSKALMLRAYSDDEGGGYAHDDCLDGAVNDDYTAEDLALIKEHNLEESGYDDLYDRVLKDTKEFGTQAMAALQALVISDIESGRHD